MGATADGGGEKQTAAGAGPTYFFGSAREGAANTACARRDGGSGSETAAGNDAGDGKGAGGSRGPAPKNTPGADQAPAGADSAPREAADAVDSGRGAGGDAARNAGQPR